MSRIFVGMSGGVDSSAAAWLLREQGHTIEGITFVGLTEQGSRKCCSLEEINAAREVCRFLGIPHHTLDLKDVFRARIVAGFVADYKQGRTPNPCINCNRYVKFGALLEYSLSQGAEAIATGHYARLDDTSGELLIRQGVDQAKDQSYFLAYIQPDHLPFMHFPVGGMVKSQVRAVVDQAGLPLSPSKTESQDICFIKDDYRDFLKGEGVEENPGEFYYQGRPVGQHRGIPFYSYGQRRGLQVSVGQRLFVRDFDHSCNRIILGERPSARVFTVDGLNIFSRHFETAALEVQIRYQSRRTGCRLLRLADSTRVECEQELDIVSPGQLAVFYHGDAVYGSGIIRRVEQE